MFSRGKSVLSGTYGEERRDWLDVAHSVYFLYFFLLSFIAVCLLKAANYYQPTVCRHSPGGRPVFCRRPSRTNNHSPTYYLSHLAALKNMTENQTEPATVTLTFSTTLCVKCRLVDGVGGKRGHCGPFFLVLVYVFLPYPVFYM